MSLEDQLHRFLSSYISAPQWVKLVAGGVYSTIPMSVRRGGSYERYREILRDKNIDSISRYSQMKLAETLSSAVRCVPAYRGLVHHDDCLNDPELSLLKFPIVGKKELKSNLSLFLSNSKTANSRLETYTGGSTAEPMKFYLEKGVTRPRESAFMDDFQSKVGLTDDKLVVALRGRSVPSTAKSGGRLWMYEPIKREIILSSDHLEARCMPQYMDVLRKYKPAFIQAFPSAIYPFALWLADHPVPEITEKIKGILLYSENAYDYQVDLLRKVFKCPVLKHYGHSERVLMAATMPDDDRYFFWPQYGHIELVDTSGNRINEPNVLGEIVGTSFDNRVMPFVRYRTGDLAMWSSRGEHRLLPGYPAVERIEGRLQEFVICRDNRLVSICTLGAAHFDELALAESIQYEQKVPGTLLVKVVSSTPLSADKKRNIENAIMKKTQGGCDAQVIEVGHISRTARGKHVMLIQHLNIDSYFGDKKFV
jgi:phenylacetate-CoA ligase